MARDHTDAIANYGSATPPQHSGDLTIAAWVRPDGEVDFNPVGSWAESVASNTQDKQLAINAGLVRAYIFDGAGVAVEGSTTVSAGAWAHVLMEHEPTDASNGDLRVFLNGTQDGSTTGAGNSYTGYTTPEFLVGRLQASGFGDKAFDGRIAWVTVWDTILSSNEKVALANGVDPFIIRPSNCLICLPWWGIHSPEIDLSGNDRSATINGTLSRVNDPPVTLYTPKWAATMPLIEVADAITIGEIMAARQVGGIQPLIIPAGVVSY